MKTIKNSIKPVSHFLIFIFFLFSVKPLTAQDSINNNALKVRKIVLDNGLTVLLNEDHSLPEILGGVVVKAGSKHDPHDATGMAHYLEHMCFKGTKDLGTTDFEKEKPYLDEIYKLYDQLGQTKKGKERAEIQKKINEESVKASEYAIPNEMDRLLKSIGGKGVNAFTSFEVIVYHNSFPPHQVEKWLDIYSHRFVDPVFRLFQPELEVVYEEKNMGSDDFGNALFETYIKHFYKKHPYGQQPTIGLTEHLKNPSLTKMYEYYNKYFVANNMALVLTGDFDSEKIIPIIKEKFGSWRSGKIEPFVVPKEEPFKGRELITKRYSPIKLGVMGFRTVPKGHPDEEALAVCNYLLSNPGETGMLDELRQNNKIQMAMVFSMPLNDYGGSYFIFVPKILRQSLPNAEKQMLTAIGKIKTGDFEESLLAAAKNNLQVDFYRQLESASSRGFFIAETFSQGEEWENFLKYPKKIASITLDDVKRVANKYYGKDYLVMYSRMGFPPKDKIKKPPFEPVKPKENVKSKYAEYFEKLNVQKPQPNFVNFDRDISQLKIKNNVPVYITKNPINNIASVTIEYGIGNFRMPVLSYVASYYNYIGTKDISARDFKRKMSALGFKYSFSSDERSLKVELEGLEDKLDEALVLLNKLILDPARDEKKFDLMVSDEKTSRKLEMADPQTASGVLSSYLIMKDNSRYLKRLSIAELKKLTPDSLVKIMNEAIQYQAAVHFSGIENPDQVAQLFNIFSFPEHPKASLGAEPLPRIKYTEPTVLFLNRKDARQSHIIFYGLGKKLDNDDIPSLKAFNSYFGGDMSSLVFQEIRELRSLAYAASCTYRRPFVKEEAGFLYGYIGCQGDKTQDALSGMMDLIKKMPEKPDRMDAVRSGLRDAAYTSRPEFRDLSEVILRWKRLGYKQDPEQYYLAYYDKLNFEDIKKFYTENVQNLPVSIAIVGNKKNIDMKKLSQYGKIIEVNKKEILKK